MIDLLRFIRRYIKDADRREEKFFKYFGKGGDVPVVRLCSICWYLVSRIVVLNHSKIIDLYNLPTSILGMLKR